MAEEETGFHNLQFHEHEVTPDDTAVDARVQRGPWDGGEHALRFLDDPGGWRDRFNRAPEVTLYPEVARLGALQHSVRELAADEEQREFARGCDLVQVGLDHDVTAGAQLIHL